MLNGIHIWRICGPWKDVDVLICKKLPCTCYSMRSGVVMHQHPKVLIKEWNSYGARYVVYITLGVQIPPDNNKICLPPHPPIMPPQTIALPPPNWLRSRTQKSSNLSPFLQYTRICPSAKLNLNRDSSVKSTLAHTARVQHKWCRAQRKRKLRVRRLMI